jgi:threonine dehydratase
MTATASATQPALITLDDLADAASTLKGVAVRTPLLPDETLTQQLGVPIFVKPEMLQRGGAFKLRGAYNFLAKLSQEDRQRGVIAPSSGNHAQAVALAAKLFGVKATVVMPETVTAAKRGGAERLGARIELAGTTTYDRLKRAEEIAATEGGVLVPPYDHPTIIAGQGTAGLEIAEDMPDLRTILVQVGGGGLSAGVATAIKLRCPKATVIGIEPEGAPKLSRARAAGQPTKLEKSSSIADGLMAVEIGTTPFAHHRRYVDDVVTVPDAELKAAMLHLMNRMKLVAEPSGAITIAALMHGRVKPAGKTVAVLSGGNIEWEGLTAILGA